MATVCEIRPGVIDCNPSSWRVVKPAYPQISIEQTGNNTTGELILPAARGITRWEPTQVVLAFLNALNKNTSDSERVRNMVTFGLCNNTPSNTSSGGVINTKIGYGYERPVSAYFFYDQRSSSVIIKWGLVNPCSGQAKIHEVLYGEARVKELIVQGAKLSSGHMARVCPGNEVLALFDCIRPNARIDSLSPLGITINTLYNNGFIPLTGEGRVQLPVFNLE